MQNPNCDGEGPHTGNIVKLYPLGSEPLHGNLILCHSCWYNENRHRFNLGREMKGSEDWPQHNWHMTETYSES